MAVRFNTTEFQFSHGHGPRGRGGWWFEFVRHGDRLANPDHAHLGGDLAFAWPCPGGSRTFSDAKGWARLHARLVGAEEVRVCS